MSSRGLPVEAQPECGENIHTAHSDLYCQRVSEVWSIDPVIVEVY